MAICDHNLQKRIEGKWERLRNLKKKFSSAAFMIEAAKLFDKNLRIFIGIADSLPYLKAEVPEVMKFIS